MSGQVSVRLRGLATAVALLLLGLLALGAGPAAANTIVNGDFETGTLEGWTQLNEPEESGSWIAYTGTENPFEFGGGPPLTPPPQGNYAASSVQGGPGAHFLYQDFPVQAGQAFLSMTVYYRSEAPLAVPNPDTLSSEIPGANQQYRIEVIDPSAPIDTVNPSDILATVFRTTAVSPTFRSPEAVGVDLTQFVGRTVRLRLVEVDNEGYFTAGVDSVTTGPVSPPPSPPAPSNAFTFGKLKLNKKKGTATLKLNVPGPGTLVSVDAKKKGKRIKRATATATAAGAAILKLKPTGRGKKTLKQKGKLPFKLSVTFTPTGGTAATQTFSGKLKLQLPKR